MRWVAKRWQVTRRLYLHAPPKNALACALAAMQEAVPAALTYLDLAWSRHDDAPTLSVLLTWLAGRIEGLQTLVIQAYGVHCLPPMLNLKHLVVCQPCCHILGLATTYKKSIIKPSRLRAAPCSDMDGVWNQGFQHNGKSF